MRCAAVVSNPTGPDPGALRRDWQKPPSPAGTPSASPGANRVRERCREAVSELARTGAVAAGGSAAVPVRPALSGRTARGEQHGGRRDAGDAPSPRER
jgi:hypothetical protein